MKEKKFLIDFVDLRDEHWIIEEGVCVDKIKLPGDPKGTVQIDLAKNSFFDEHRGQGKRYYGAFYDINETNLHHTDDVHEYMISRSVLEANVFISLPKLKTHKKVGVTVNLKGLVGINGNKNWLPHYSLGSPEENGDQFISKSAGTQLENQLVIRAKRLLLARNPVVQLLARKFKKAGYLVFGPTDKVIRSGNWHGNDTCWRMTLDLNRILLYGNSDGTFRTTPKKYFSVVDGIMGMEGNGPVAGKPKAAGYIIAGFNPLATDLVCTRLMGFDYRKIPMLSRAFAESSLPFAAFAADEVCVISNQRELEGNLVRLMPNPEVRFEPHFGWKGHVEL